MRSILSFITSLIILIPAIGQGRWEVVNEGTLNDFRSVDFINQYSGWYAGGNGLFRTTDGAETWTEAYYSVFRAIDFYNDTLGWAIIIENAGIWKTIDGGQMWFSQKTFEDINGWGFYDIYAIDDSTVYAIEDKGLFKTIDGGTNWVDITPPGDNVFRDGCFLNTDKGVLIGKDENGEPSIFRTFNGGESWNVRRTWFREICDIEFLNDSIGYFRARTYNNGNISAYRLYESTDSFNSWSVVSNEKYSIRAFHFFDNDVAVSVMEDSSSVRIMKSEDGGLTWENSGDKTLPVDWDYQFIFLENAGYLIISPGAVCSRNNNIFLKTVNQGISWEVLNFSYPFREVFFISDTEGFFAGGLEGWHCWYGNLIKTDDGFKTFDFLPGMGGTNDQICQFTGDSVGYYYDGHLFRTSDRGERWIEDTAFSVVHDIYFINDSIGFAIADEGIYKTTSGGISWHNVYSYEYEDRTNSIFFIDEYVGWSISETKMIIHDEEQGWREIPLETDLPLNRIYFVDHDHGWISGGYNNYDEGYHPLFLRSVNGGESWSEVAGLNYLINDFYFKTFDHGWAVGEDMEEKGIILETFDSGLTWEVVVDSLSARLNALHFKDGHGWAVGENGLILNMFDTTCVSGVERSDSFINSEVLLRLYPNPVISILKIETSSSDHFNIEITSLNGCLIYRGEMQGSTHQLDLSRFQSGVYLITLRSKDSLTTRKIVKL